LIGRAFSWLLPITARPDVILPTDKRWMAFQNNIEFPKKRFKQQEIYILRIENSDQT